MLIFAMLGVAVLSAETRQADKWADFFEQPHENCVDYIFRVFDDADIVILGERHHQDMTQYDLIRELISDPRFAERIGNVYTEVGCTNHTDEVNELIGKDIPDSLFRHELLRYLLNEDYYPLWEKTNRSVFLTDLHNVNKNLSEDKRIYLGLTDLPFDWDTIHTHEEWVKNAEEIDRDTVMAQNFIRLYKSRQQPKALLITNTPHAMLGREGGLIKERYGDKVKTVVLNWSIWWGDKTGPYENGCIDDAYIQAGAPAIGFDLKDTPFSELPLIRSSLGIHADGMVWYKAYDDWILSIGITGILDSDEALLEVSRRDKIAFPDNEWNLENMRNYYNRQRTYKMER